MLARIALIPATIVVALAACVAHALAATPMNVFVDASHAPERIYHCRVSMSVSPGAFTFVYPKWIPGFHGPVGPLPDVVNLHVSASGNPITWHRDLVDLYAIHTDVPAGATSVEVDFDVVDAPLSIGEQDPSETPKLAIIQWSSFLMYPQGSLARTLPVNASLVLPQGWKFGTALHERVTDGATVSFDTVSLETLVDSPLNAGAFFRRITLASDPLVELDLAADSAAALDIRADLLAAYKRLVREAPALYENRHYRSYHFLLCLTDAITDDGIEHHESSDDRAPEDYLTDPDTFLGAGADLLAHEYSHSWNGKYRRPADLATPDFQAPMKTDLLWVYEGLNQYLGELLSVRSGMVTPAQARELDAMTAASMDTAGGRTWRSLGDTATEAPILYVTPSAWATTRRNANDIYSEGDLVWLEIDTIIRRESADKKSLDDFMRRFTSGGSTTPSVKTYTLDDVIATLQSTVPYDWRTFLHDRVDLVMPHAPLAGLENAGWRLTYGETPSEMWKAYEDESKVTDLRYSVGVIVNTDSGSDNGNVIDVLANSPADRAGIAPGMKIIAVDGRAWSPERFHIAIQSAAATHQPIDVLISNGDYFGTLGVTDYSGNRYPQLERIAGTPDLLTTIFAPLASR